MRLYKISCYSECGSYFGSYLQSVTVCANSEARAITIAQDFANSRGGFIHEGITIENLGAIKAGVIDYHEDSDY